MAEINPPFFMGNGCYSPLRDRQLWGTVVCAEGVRVAGGTGTDLRVGSRSDGAPLTIRIAAGEAYVQGDDVENQGLYHVVNDGAIELSVDAPDPTDTRIDLVVARIHDGQYSGDPSEASWAIEVVTGTPSPAPTPPDVPNSALPLAEVTIAPGTTQTQPGMITDIRDPWVWCPSNPRQLKPGTDLDDFLTPGLFVAATDAEATNITNWPTPHGPKYAGILEVINKTGYGERIQRVTEFARNNFLVWQRNRTGAVGNEQWGPWFSIGGPGRWLGVSSGIYTVNSSNFTGPSAPTGASQYGMRLVNGEVQAAFRVQTVRDLTFNFDGNIGDVNLGTVTNPNYRPEIDAYIPAVVPGRTTAWVRVNTNGVIDLTHGAPDFSITTDLNLDVLGSWKARGID